MYNEAQCLPPSVGKFIFYTDSFFFDTKIVMDKNIFVRPWKNERLARDLKFLNKTCILFKEIFVHVLPLRDEHFLNRFFVFRVQCTYPSLEVCIYFSKVASNTFIHGISDWTERCFDTIVTFTFEIDTPVSKRSKEYLQTLRNLSGPSYRYLSVTASSISV